MICFVTLTNKKPLLPLQCRLKQNFLFDLENLIEYLASAVNTCHLIVVFDLYQELRYLLSYYQYAKMSSYQLQN